MSSAVVFIIQRGFARNGVVDAICQVTACEAFGKRKGRGAISKGRNILIGIKRREADLRIIGRGRKDFVA